jgi:hypothetical protein
MTAWKREWWESEAIDWTRRRGGAEEDAEKNGNKLAARDSRVVRVAEPAESAEEKTSELRSDGKLICAPICLQ